MGRDMAMAIDFLFLRKTLKDTDVLLDTLRKYDKKYGKESKIPMSDNAIYSAINRGVSAIKERGSLQINIGAATREIRFDSDYENGYLCDLTDKDDDLKQKADDIKELYSLVADYIEEKVPRRRIK